VDGKTQGNEVMVTPYSLSLNTWYMANGQHTLSAVARDRSGNRATASVGVTVSNVGPPPKVADKVVFSDALQSPFRNTSWGSTVNLGTPDPDPSKTGNTSVRVNYMAWGAFDILSGDWGAEIPIDVTVYDSLKFDYYPMAQIDVGVNFYIGSEYLITGAPVGKWTSYTVPLPTAPFTRFYVVNKTDQTFTAYFDNIRFAGKIIASSVGGDPTVATDFSLEQNYPNPFKPSTTIRFTIPNEVNVSLKVYNLLGQLVATLVDESRTSGTYTVNFDAGSSGPGGHALSSGVYLYRLQAGSYVETRRLMLLK
jgi:hypothetical protein